MGHSRGRATARWRCFVWYGAMLVALALAVLTDAQQELVQRVPVQVDLPGHAGRAEQRQELKLLVPTKSREGAMQVSTPSKVHDLAVQAWNAVVDGNDVGLLDPKVEARRNDQVRHAPLSAEEAWHHWQAAQQGVVDSGRFLITFGVAVSVQSGGSDLHIAAALGETDRCRALLDDPDRPEMEVDMRKDVDGTTPLYCAIATGQVDTVRFLLRDAGANPELHGNNGVRPLMLAATLGHLEIIKELVSSGADVDAQHSFGGTTALHFAAEMGHAIVIQYLCQDASADAALRKTTGGTALHTAADTNQTEAARALVHHCTADVHALLAGDTTPLYLAAQRGLTSLVRVLIEELGANPNFEMPKGQNVGKHVSVVDDEEDPKAAERRRQAQYYETKNTEIGNGATALHAAAENGHRETVEALLSLGALQTGSMEGATPLVIALQYHHPEIALDLLDESGSDPQIHARVPRDGSWSLLTAVDLVHESAANRRVLDKLLHWPGIQVDLDNGRGITPLTHAIARRRDDVVVSLFDVGATVFAAQPSAIMVACQIGMPAGPGLHRLIDAAQEERALLDWAAKRGADAGTHPIHAAAANGHLHIVRELLHREKELVDLQAAKTGATSLMLAAQSGHLDVVTKLVAAGANVNARGGKTIHGATALYLASDAGHANIVEYLLQETPADGSLALNEFGTTPLHVSIERKRHSVTRTLLDYATSRASINLKTAGGLTPLASAVKTGNPLLVRTLIQAGANTQVRLEVAETEEATLLQFALHQGRHVGISVIEVLASSSTPMDKVSFELCVMELLRLQTSPKLYREPREAAQLLTMLLSKVDAELIFPEYALFIIANVYEGSDGKEELRHGEKLLEALSRSAQWARLDASGRGRLLLHASELTGELSPLQAAVQRSRPRLAKALLLAAEEPELSTRMVHLDQSFGKLGSALMLAQARRDFRMLKVLQEFVVADHGIHEEL